MADQSHANEVRVPSLIFCVVTPLVVTARFLSRYRYAKLGADDWTILAALICAFSVNVLMLVAANYGFGQHIASVPAARLSIALEVFYFAQIVYKIGIALTKISILLLFLQIFRQRPFRLTAWTLLVVVAAYGVACAVASVFQCTPIRKAWHGKVPGHCISLEKSWYSNAGFSIATDVLILVLPIPVVLKLQLPLKKRIGLCLVFGFGGFVTVTSILRMTTLSFSSTSPDTTYNITSSLWTIVEENVGVICACLPIFRVPVLNLLPRIFRSSENKSFSRIGADKSYGDLETAGSHPRETPLSPLHTKDSKTPYRPERVSSKGGILKETDFSVRYDVGQAKSTSRRGSASLYV